MFVYEQILTTTNLHGDAFKSTTPTEKSICQWKLIVTNAPVFFSTAVTQNGFKLLGRYETLGRDHKQRAMEFAD